RRPDRPRRRRPRDAQRPHLLEQTPKPLSTASAELGVNLFSADGPRCGAGSTARTGPVAVRQHALAGDHHIGEDDRSNRMAAVLRPLVERSSPPRWQGWVKPYRDGIPPTLIPCAI